MFAIVLPDTEDIAMRARNGGEQTNFRQIEPPALLVGHRYWGPSEDGDHAVDVEGMNAAGRGIDQTDPFTPAMLKGRVFHRVPFPSYTFRRWRPAEPSASLGPVLHLTIAERPILA